MTLDRRRLTEADHASLRAIRLRALAGEPRAFGSTYERELAFDETVWRHRLRPEGNPHFGGFDARGGLVGLAAGVLPPDEATVAELVSMWVDPVARGTGLAAELATDVLSWADALGCRTVRLTVVDGNERAEGSYRRLGFVRTGRTQRRDRDGVLEVEMQMEMERRPES